MMKKLMVLLLLCHAASAVKHTLKFNLMISSGVSNLPDYVVTADVEGGLMGYYDSSMKTAEPRQDWAREVVEDEPQQWETLSKNCKNYQQEFTDETKSFTQHSNQTGGVHVIQQIMGCEWDNDTNNVNGFKLFGYNGEDFITFDVKTETWITFNLLAENTKQEWDRNTGKNVIWKNILTTMCPDWLKIFLNYRKPFAYKKVLPTVSLLQRSPSSPVSCHATGFYPDKAAMLWRKDGEEIHEDVDHGEILPNHDGTFQMSVDLKLSSVKPEDWSRYECGFQLSGVEDSITKLDKTVIRTNWGKNINRTYKENSDMMIPIIAAAFVLLVLVLIAAVGFAVHKKKKDQHQTSPPENNTEVFETLTPETT